MNAEEGKQQNSIVELPGRQLREARERHSLTVAQAAHELHVDEALLRALENDEFEKLGAPIFVKGHLRNYARMLGLDAAHLISAYEEMLRPADPVLQTRAASVQRMGKSGTSIRWLRGISSFVVIALLIGLAGWWYYQRDSLPRDTGPLTLSMERQPASEEPVTVEPERQAPAAPEIEFAETVPGAAFEPEDGDPANADGAGAALGGPALENETLNEAGATARLPIQTQTAESLAATPERGMRAAVPLQLQFREESWVEVYDAEGRPVLYDLVRAGATRELNERGEVRLFLGNAPGVDIRVNGEAFDLKRYIRSDNTARFRIDLNAAD